MSSTKPRSVEQAVRTAARVVQGQVSRPQGQPAQAVSPRLKAPTTSAWNTPRTRTTSKHHNTTANAASAVVLAGPSTVNLTNTTSESTSVPISPDLLLQTSQPGEPLVAFISGPVESDPEYFQTHYAARIATAIEAGHHFVLGSSKGIDSFALEFLLGYPRSLSIVDEKARGLFLSRVTVHLTQSEGRNQKIRQSPLLKALERGGGKVVVFVPPPTNAEDNANSRRDPNLHWTQRDEAMTRASHYDILRYRADEECRTLYGAKYRKRVSGTEKNELRRKSGVGLTLHEQAGLI